MVNHHKQCIQHSQHKVFLAGKDFYILHCNIPPYLGNLHLLHNRVLQQLAQELVCIQSRMDHQ